MSSQSGIISRRPRLHGSSHYVDGVSAFSASVQVRLGSQVSAHRRFPPIYSNSGRCRAGNFTQL